MLKKNKKLKRTVTNQAKKIDGANVITPRNNEVNKNVVEMDNIDNNEVFVENLRRKIEQKKNKRLLKRSKKKDNLKNAALLNNKNISNKQSSTRQKTKPNKKDNRENANTLHDDKTTKAPASDTKNDVVKSKPSPDSNEVKLTKESSKQVNGLSAQSSDLREKMLNKLKASRFRYLNEQLYMNESKNARKLFGSDRRAFEAYHEGYDLQVARWPINPLNLVIKSIKKL